MSRSLDENMHIVYMVPALYRLVKSIFRNRSQMNEGDFNNFVNFILSGDEAVNTIATIRHQIKEMESDSIQILGEGE